MKRLLFFTSIVAAASFFLISGCHRPTTGRVEGMVTLDGKPVVGASVITVPDQGVGGFAITDSAGKFVLGTRVLAEKSLVAGSHRIGVTKFDNTGNSDSPEAPQKQLIPEKYVDPFTSGLSVEVVPGKTKTITLELSSNNRS